MNKAIMITEEVSVIFLITNCNSSKPSFPIFDFCNSDDKSEILLVSKKLNIDITWYEDLYGEDIDLNKYKNHLHPQNLILQ